MSKELKNLRASETALGVIPIREETKAQAQMRGSWERRLAPLGLALPDKVPPDDMWYRIRSSLDRSEDRKSVFKAKRGISRWRWLSLLLAGLSAALIAFIVTNGFGTKTSADQEAETPSTPVTTSASALSAPAGDGETTQSSFGSVVAVATPDGSKQALILELDPEAETALIRPVGVTIEEGKDLEIWRVTSRDAPASLGLVAPEKETTVSLKLNAGDTIVVTLEPEGGSTIGTPSGPTVFSAPLIEMREPE